MKTRIDECDGGESRAYRFERIALRRKNEIVKKIRLLSNCSNKSSYDYYEYQIKGIFKEIQTELKLAKGRFGVGKPTPDYLVSH
ncbi:MAG: hypothetical protein ABFD79_16970 [Phycisphaerales bacterium]